MSKQIAIRLPDELVEYIDDLVRAGEVESRARFVTKAIKRERRRRDGLHDAEIYARTEPDPDLQALAEWTSRHPVSLDD